MIHLPIILLFLGLKTFNAISELEFDIKLCEGKMHLGRIELMTFGFTGRRSNR